MSDWDKQRAKYWEEEYNKVKTNNGCLSFILAIMIIIFVLIAINNL